MPIKSGDPGPCMSRGLRRALSPGATATAEACQPRGARFATNQGDLRRLSFVRTCAAALVPVQTFARADLPGQHPYYGHALSNLCAPRWMAAAPRGWCRGERQQGGRDQAWRSTICTLTKLRASMRPAHNRGRLGAGRRSAHVRTGPPRHRACATRGANSAAGQGALRPVTCGGRLGTQQVSARPHRGDVCTQQDQSLHRFRAISRHKPATPAPPRPVDTSAPPASILFSDNAIQFLSADRSKGMKSSI